MCSLVLFGVGIPGTSQQRQPQLHRWTISTVRHDPGRIVSVFGVVQQCHTETRLAAIHPAQRAHLETCGVPAGVGVDRGRALPELHLASERGRVHIDRERHLQQRFAFVPIDLTFDIETR